MFKKEGNKSGQTTIFIIIGILIVALVLLFLALRKGSVDVEQIPVNLEPPYVAFTSCINDYSNIGISLLERQGGYIQLPDFEPGSPYMPFSSQLNFMGDPIPYWYYVSGNNIQKEQVPSKNEMEEQLANFVEASISDCDLSSYSSVFEIEKGEPKASAIIRDGDVQINLEMDFSISDDVDNALVKDHVVIVKSDLGSLYTSAVGIYQQEQEELFLEEHGVDILRAYAPVDGVEITCSPLIWDAEEVFNTLQEGIEANTLALKANGDSDDYFNLDLGVSHDVRFLNSPNWSNNFEVLPSDGRVLISSPVGNQPGLGILGFCYVPYHFVYNMGYPVLVQVYDDNEIFQFPVAVVIRGNKAREALEASAVEIGIPELCQYKNTLIEVNSYDNKFGPVDAEISYECSSTSCYIGSTFQGTLKTYFPQCVNGRIAARAEGYEDAEYTFSSLNSGSVDVVLDKLYPLEVRLNVDGRASSKQAIISFISDRSSKTISYPEQKTIELSQGQYEVQVYVYDNATLKFAETTTEQCVEVPRGGIGGILGLTEEKCVDIVIPEQIISQVLSGGGKTNTTILESELERVSRVEMSAESLPKPSSLEELQINYLLFEDRDLDVNLR